MQFLQLESRGGEGQRLESDDEASETEEKGSVSFSVVVLERNDISRLGTFSECSHFFKILF